MPPSRKRLSPQDSRAAAMDAARAILLEDGPQAVTLKAVAARMGRTHANLLHHFGTAAGLQKELAGSMAEQVCANIADIVLAARKGEREADPRMLVDLTFDAFDQQGAGALATWMIMSGNLDALDPILNAIHKLLDQLHLDRAEDERSMHEDTLTLVLMALGDALLGGPMAKALNLPRESAREIALKQLLASPRLAARLGIA
jgi:AcrR family transcriptional regulator